MSDDILGQGSGDSQPLEAPTSSPETAATAPPPELHTIKWNGQDKQLPYQELVALAQKGFDYTQKLGKFSETEKQYRTRLEQYESALGEIRDFLGDRSRIESYLKQAFAEQQAQAAQGAADPNELITQQQLQAQMAQMSQAQQQQFVRQLQSMKAEMEVSQLAADYSGQINHTIKGLVDQMPELQAIPRIEKLLKDEVRERNPENIQHARQLLQEVAAEFAGRAKGFFETRQKQAVAQSSPLQRGIEPPGGAAPSAPPTPAFKKVDDPRLRELVMQDLLQAVRK